MEYPTSEIMAQGRATGPWRALPDLELAPEVILSVSGCPYVSRYHEVWLLRFAFAGKPLRVVETVRIFDADVMWKLRSSESTQGDALCSAILGAELGGPRAMRYLGTGGPALFLVERWGSTVLYRFREQLLFDVTGGAVLTERDYYERLRDD